MRSWKAQLAWQGKCSYRVLLEGANGACEHQTRINLAASITQILLYLRILYEGKKYFPAESEALCLGTLVSVVWLGTAYSVLNRAFPLYTQVKGLKPNDWRLLQSTYGMIGAWASPI